MSSLVPRGVAVGQSPVIVTEARSESATRWHKSTAVGSRPAEGTQDQTQGHLVTSRLRSSACRVKPWGQGEPSDLPGGLVSLRPGAAAAGSLPARWDLPAVLSLHPAPTAPGPHSSLPYTIMKVFMRGTIRTSSTFSHESAGPGALGTGNLNEYRRRNSNVSGVFRTRVIPRSRDSSSARHREPASWGRGPSGLGESEPRLDV